MIFYTNSLCGRVIGSNARRVQTEYLLWIPYVDIPFAN